MLSCLGFPALRAGNPKQEDFGLEVTDMEKTTGRREQKKQLTRRAILKAAAEEFSVRGVTDTTVAHIMERAGLGIGTFYNYFASKDEVLLSMTTATVHALQKQAADLKERRLSATETLAHLSATVAEFIDENRFVLQLFHNAADNFARPHNGAKPEDSHKSPGFKPFFEQIIRQGQQNGEIRCDIPIAVMTEMFHAIYQAAALSKINLAYKDNVAQKITLLLDGMKASHQNP